MKKVSFGSLGLTLLRDKTAQRISSTSLMEKDPLHHPSSLCSLSGSSAGDAQTHFLVVYMMVKLKISFLVICRRYGFERARSKQALEAGGGEVGTTLERLLLQVFCERYGQKAVCPGGLKEVSMDECLIYRQEEALALAAIYGERFSERITNVVWTITLDLPFLSGNVVGQGRGARNCDADTQKVCQFYMKGKGCRFGDKCRFIHQLPNKETHGAAPPDPKGPSQPGFTSYSPPEYELEIRFPKGNHYPFETPIVAFSTTDESVGAAGRLSVSERLFGEALAAAKSSDPVVYTLISLCEDETVMRELLAVGHHKYSTAPSVLEAPLPSPGIAKGKSGRSNGHEESRSRSSVNHATSRKTVATNNNRAINGELKIITNQSFWMCPG